MYKILINSLILFFVVLIFYQTYLTNHPIVEGFAKKKSNKESKSDKSDEDSNEDSTCNSSGGSSSDSIIVINSQIKDINTDIVTMKSDIKELKQNVIVLNDQIKAMNSSHNKDIQNVSDANLTVDSAVN